CLPRRAGRSGSRAGSMGAPGWTVLYSCRTGESRGRVCGSARRGGARARAMGAISPPGGAPPRAPPGPGLGGVRGWVGAEAVAEAAGGRRRAAGLVKLLALAPAHGRHREQLLEALWPDLDRDGASNQLYRALHFARRILAPRPPHRLAAAYLGWQGEQ